jgi:hypothetical protein
MPAALALVLGQAACGQPMAKVVRDGKPSNPAVEAGGYRPPVQPPPDVPYSLTGAVAASEGTWFTHYALWPWRMMLDSLSFRPRREPAFMVHSLPPERRPPHFFPPP